MYHCTSSISLSTQLHVVGECLIDILHVYNCIYKDIHMGEASQPWRQKRTCAKFVEAEKLRVDSTDARGASKMTLGLSSRNVETQCHSTFFSWGIASL